MKLKKGLGLNEFMVSLYITCDHYRLGKDYSGAKFFYTESISLNKAHSTK